MKNNVWVCLEQNDGKIAGVSFEMLSEARKLADPSCPVRWALS